jgi:molybdopterin converting factor small subunit
MRITVEHWNQLREAAGIASESVELAEGDGLPELMRRLVARHGSDWSALVLAADGSLRPSTIVSCNGELGPCRRPLRLRDGDVLALLLPVAGG